LAQLAFKRPFNFLWGIEKARFPGWSKPSIDWFKRSLKEKEIVGSRLMQFEDYRELNISRENQFDWKMWKFSQEHGWESWEKSQVSDIFNQQIFPEQLRRGLEI
jgi:hypothetical protein